MTTYAVNRDSDTAQGRAIRASEAGNAARRCEHVHTKRLVACACCYSRPGALVCGRCDRYVAALVPA